MKEKQSFFYSENQKIIGPISFKALSRRIFSGKILEQTLVWSENVSSNSKKQENQAQTLSDNNESNWKKKRAAIDIPELSDFFENRYISDRLGLSLLNLVCCPPIGILGLILGIKINKWKALRDFDRAKKLSRWTALILICGFSFLIVFLLLPPFSSAREAARRMQCTHNLKQIMIAMHNYHDQYQSFPPAFTTDSNGQPLHSWRVLLLPFMEQQELYEKIRLNEPWDSDWNSQFHNINIPEFICPSGFHYFCQNDETKPLMKGLCFYSIIFGDQTAFPDNETRTFGDITDGSSNTIALVERKLPVCWMTPKDEISFQTALNGISQNLTQIGSFHSGGCNAAMFDGSVRFISQTISSDVWKALLTCDGVENGEDVRE